MHTSSTFIEPINIPNVQLFEQSGIRTEQVNLNRNFTDKGYQCWDIQIRHPIQIP